MGELGHHHKGLAILLMPEIYTDPAKPGMQCGRFTVLQLQTVG